MKLCRSTFPRLGTLALLLFQSLAAELPVSQTRLQTRAGAVPTLDEMAGDWLPMADVANPPAVHNFNQMLVVDRDLTSFFCHPGGLYPWRHGYPIVKLAVDGREYPAT